ncbi:hypothetical protein CWS35_04830 [Bradyrhizobium sp. SK17]|nr:hypothetical protein CWS35_04830 [Bradyrhizobium sp. SK17]
MTIVNRLIPVAGTGNAKANIAALEPLTNDRLNLLADRLAALAPCPVTGLVTDNEIKIALGEHGDIWPSCIRGHIMVADLEGDLQPH